MKTMRPLVATLVLLVGSVWHSTDSSAKVSAAPAMVTVHGEVRDARNETPETVIPNDLPPVANANLSLIESGLSVRTDARGRFVISGVPVPPAAAGKKYSKI